MADRQSTPTRRRALTALAGITAASAVPAVAIAAGDPDAEIRRLHDAIVAQEAEIQRLNDIEEKAEAEQPTYPESPDATLHEIAALAGLDFDVYNHMNRAEFQLHIYTLPADVGARVVEADEAASAAYTRWHAERDRIDVESGWAAREEALTAVREEAYGRQAEQRDELADTPARTPRGVLLKLRAAVVLESGRECLEEGQSIDYTKSVFISVIDDMEAIAGGGDVA